MAQHPANQARPILYALRNFDFNSICEREICYDVNCSRANFQKWSFVVWLWRRGVDLTQVCHREGHHCNSDHIYHTSATVRLEGFILFSRVKCRARTFCIVCEDIHTSVRFHCPCPIRSPISASQSTANERQSQSRRCQWHRHACFGQGPSHRRIASRRIICSCWFKLWINTLHVGLIRDLLWGLLCAVRNCFSIGFEIFWKTTAIVLQLSWQIVKKNFYTLVVTLYLIVNCNLYERLENIVTNELCCVVHEHNYNYCSYNNASKGN